MTQRPAGTGVRFRPAHGLGRPRERFLAALLVLLSLVVGVVLPAPALAATADPSPTPDEGSVVVAVSPLARGLVAPDGAVALSVIVDNTTTTDVEPTTADVKISTNALADAAAVEKWIDEGQGAGSLESIDQTTIPAVPSGERYTSAVAVSVEDLPASDPGVYAVSLRYGLRTARAVVTIGGEEPPKASVAAVLAVTPGPRSTGLLTSDELTALTSEGGRLDTLLDAADGNRITLAVDPAILASIRVLGENAPAEATAWLDRLNALPNERFALQFGDADVAAQFAAGRTTLLEPTSFAYALPDGTVAATPEPSSDETADPDALLDDPEALTAVDGAVPAVFWPADGAIDAAGVTALTDATGPATVVVTDENAQAPGSVGVVGDARALIADAPASRALDAALGADELERGARLAALAAQLTLAAEDTDDTLLITSDRPGKVAPGSAQAAVRTITGMAGLTTASFGSLLSADESAETTLTGSASDARVQAVTKLDDDADALDSFATILDDPTLLTAPERTAEMQLIGAGWSADPDAWSAALAAHREATEGTLTAVAIQPPGTIQLLSPEAGLPVFVRNDLPWPVTLTLTATPDDLRLDVERLTTVRAEPGVNTRVQVPVRARVANGEVTVELRLSGPTLQQIGPTRYADVQVRAEWEGIGLGILIALVAGLLVLGLIRTVLRRRREREGSAESVEGAERSDGDE